MQAVTRAFLGPGFPFLYHLTAVKVGKSSGGYGQAGIATVTEQEKSLFQIFEMNLVTDYFNVRISQKLRSAIPGMTTNHACFKTRIFIAFCIRFHFTY
jgi:hypothetical protein